MKQSKNKGGSIRQLDSGKWRWTGCYIDPETKIKKRPNRTFNTFDEAEEYRISWLENYNAEKEKERNGLTVEDYYEIFKKRYFTNDERYYAVNTQLEYKSILNAFMQSIGKCKLDNIDFNRIQIFLDRKKCSKKRKKNILGALTSMLHKADENGYIDYAIYDYRFRKLKLRDDKNKHASRVKVHNYLTEENYKRIISVMKEKKWTNADVIEFLHETGLRIEELAITTEDVIIKKNGKLVKIENIRKQDLPEISSATIRINKSLKRAIPIGETKSRIMEFKTLKTAFSFRNVPLTPIAIMDIVNRIEFNKKNKLNPKYIFSSSTGSFLEQRNVLRDFQKAIDRCNNDIDNVPIEKRGLHSLRKLCCKNMRDVEKMDWEEIRAILGHSSVAVTQKYYYAVDDEDIEAISEKRSNKIAEKQKYVQYLIGFIEGADWEVVNGSIKNNSDGTYTIFGLPCDKSGNINVDEIDWISFKIPDESY